MATGKAELKSFLIRSKSTEMLPRLHGRWSCLVRCHAGLRIDARRRRLLVGPCSSLTPSHNSLYDNPVIEVKYSAEPRWVMAPMALYGIEGLKNIIFLKNNVFCVISVHGLQSRKGGEIRPTLFTA